MYGNTKFYLTLYRNIESGCEIADKDSLRLWHVWKRDRQYYWISEMNKLAYIVNSATSKTKSQCPALETGYPLTSISQYLRALVT